MGESCPGIKRRSPKALGGPSQDHPAMRRITCHSIIMSQPKLVAWAPLSTQNRGVLLSGLSLSENEGAVEGPLGEKER